MEQKTNATDVSRRALIAGATGLSAATILGGSNLIPEFAVAETTMSAIVHNIETDSGCDAPH